MENKKRRIQKNIKLFLNSEEGKMLDADIVKTAVAFGLIGAALVEDASAVTVHTNNFSSASHNSSLHSSHGSHGSHARGGWC